jgi:hypothetical protein
MSEETVNYSKHVRLVKRTDMIDGKVTYWVEKNGVRVDGTITENITTADFLFEEIVNKGSFIEETIKEVRL